MIGARQYHTIKGANGMKYKRTPAKGNMLKKLISSQKADKQEEDWGARQRYSKESIAKPLPGQSIMKKHSAKSKHKFDSMCGMGDWGKRNKGQNKKRKTRDWKEGHKVEPSYVHPKRVNPVPVQMEQMTALPGHSQAKVTKALKEKSAGRAWAWNKHAGNDPKAKYAMVMGEFKRGTLRSGSGQLVTNPRQAMAIARSVSSKLKYKKQVKFKGTGKMKGSQFSPAKSFLKHLARS